MIAELKSVPAALDASVTISRPPLRVREGLQHLLHAVSNHACEPPGERAHATQVLRESPNGISSEVHPELLPKRTRAGAPAPSIQHDCRLNGVKLVQHLQSDGARPHNRLGGRRVQLVELVAGGQDLVVLKVPLSRVGQERRTGTYGSPPQFYSSATWPQHTLTDIPSVEHCPMYAVEERLDVPKAHIEALPCERVDRMCRVSDEDSTRPSAVTNIVIRMAKFQRERCRCSGLY